MTRAFTATHAIDRPAEEVWRLLTDWDRAAGWLGVDRVTAEGPTAAGTRLRFTTRGKDRAAEITAVDPGRSVTVRSQQGGVTADYTYRVEPAGTGARLTLDADVRTRGAWAAIGPLLRWVIRRTDARQPAALDRERAGR
ncbi:SRPBCC family protein [Geodermatophilus sp. CPCC 205506]|uniref:SRPBCC family protein n=1 Tax=Geodermatophilus sp. CPCC 205506 TaxID=2936596 RepID=UPI003EEB84B1